MAAVTLATRLVAIHFGGRFGVWQSRRGWLGGAVGKGPEYGGDGQTYMGGVLNPRTFTSTPLAPL